MKILVAVDGSEFSAAAVEEVARRGWPAGTEIRVLSVAQEQYPPSIGAWVMPDHYRKEVMDASRANAAAIVETAVARLEEALGAGARVEGAVVEGEAKEAVLQAAEEWDADLVVVGSHGYGTFQRMLLGSVSNAIAQHARSSVLIVRRPDLRPAEAP